MTRSAESMQKKKEANARYDAANTKQLKCKLNIRTDADILKHLETIDNYQGYIKRLIREDMARTAAK